MNFATILDKDDDGDYSDEYDLNTGLHIGLGINIPVNASFSIEPGLLLTKKGMSNTEEFLGSDIDSKMNINYLEIPVNVKALIPLGNAENSFYLSAGPYLAYAVSGKIKAEYMGESEEDDLEIGTDKNNDLVKPFDMGLTIGAGFELDQIILGFSYDLGLANIATNDANGQVVSNRVFKLSIGIKL